VKVTPLHLEIKRALPFLTKLLKLFGMLALLAVAIVVLGIHDYLAVNLPVEGNILVVESWIWHSSAIREAAEEFTRGHYSYVVTLGSIDTLANGMGFQSSAQLAARRLNELGVDETRIVALDVPSVKLHHTYTSAIVLREWLIESHIKPTGINVFTMGAHARKSLVLFGRALGPGITVGVIAGTDDSYNARRWWLSPRGFYIVARKTIGYLYAILWPFPALHSAAIVRQTVT